MEGVQLSPWGVVLSEFFVVDQLVAMVSFWEAGR